VITRRVCVVTGSRADYGLLRPVMRALHSDPGFELQLVATGSHLCSAHGSTVETIENDGFVIAERVEMLLSSDTAVGITMSMGVALIGFAGVLERLKPHLMLVLGDRFEVLAAVEAAVIAGTPVAHLSGGDITEGAYDDSIRHAITKLSHLHFASTDEAAQRVVQMGEDPSRVVAAGLPGLDDLLRFEPLSRADLEVALGFQLRMRNLLVTYHPATQADEPPSVVFGELLAALDELGDEIGLILTLPNPDVAHRVIAEMTQDFVSERPHAVAHRALGPERYWSCLRHVHAVVGNSSSGLIEAPALGVPAVNIGDRQCGRLRSPSTIDCGVERDAILKALRSALTQRDVPAFSPYGDGHATERILATLHGITDWSSLLHKQFHPLKERV
jgi:UDP-hydrolysing UDP-N-acetyl-D-glucosamine 2-epimerase